MNTEEDDYDNYDDITAATITIEEIQSGKSPTQMFVDPSINFREKDIIDTLLSDERNYCIFYISSHGECLTDDTKFVCPLNTLLLQTGANNYCTSEIYSGYDAAYVNSINIRPTLYEMIGECSITPPFLASILFSTPGYDVPNKQLSYNLDKDDYFKFGVFYTESSGIYRIQNDALDELFTRGKKCTTYEIILALNSVFTTTVNIYYFSSCSDIENISGYRESYKLWKTPTHGINMGLKTHSGGGTIDCTKLFEKETVEKVTPAYFYKGGDAVVGGGAAATGGAAVGDASTRWGMSGTPMVFDNSGGYRKIKKRKTKKYNRRNRKTYRRRR